MLDEARRRTRLDDFDEDETFHAALGLLLRSFGSEACLKLIGRIAARQDLLRLLSTRLRLVDARKRRADVRAQEIRRPIFLTGLPRTGTTFLQTLLAQDPANRTPRHWETVFPLPTRRRRGTRDPRVVAAERHLRWFHRLQPRMRRIHPMGALLPEECLIITSHSFLSFQFQTTHHVPTYETWLEAQDLRPAYAWHRRFLQVLQASGDGDGGERWVLKAPAHLFGLPALFAIYPDARVVFTHRDPTVVSASLASLTTVLRSTFSDAVDPVAVGREMSARWAGAVARAFRDRDGGCAPPDRFFDIGYDDLVRDPLGTVRWLYAHFDLPLTAGAEDAMRAYVVRNSHHRDGRHEYTAAQFGLEGRGAGGDFDSYRHRLGS